MKKLIILCGAAACILNLSAQCPSNNTDTDPNSVYTSPTATNQSPYPYQPFQTNKYDWKAGGWARYIVPTGGNAPIIGTLPQAINSPFFSNLSYLTAHIAATTNSDFYPQDGWELIKQDMG